MAFSKHYDPTAVDLDALSPWERELHERELAARPAQGAAQDYARRPADEPAGQDVARAALAVADAVLALLLSAQSSNPVRAAIDWPDVLEGLVERGGAGRAELDGALAWGLIDAAVHADLVDLAESPGA